jgi:cob(I)alamin adenosyltransferase
MTSSYRLSTITTRTGDEGQSGLANGSRFSKSHPRFHALGTVDELNAHLGLLRSSVCESEGYESIYATFLGDLQHHLFLVGSELALPERAFIEEHHVHWLEEWIAHFQHFLEPLKEFILPGGASCSSQAHLARTVCRRAERDLIQLHEQAPQRPPLRCYINRLSDALFVLARFLNQQTLQSDSLWDPHHEASLPPHPSISHTSST